VDGPAVADYEREFARRVGVAHALAFSAGRVGLFGLLSALEIGPGDEVLLQAPTHIVVANAIRYTGATPVYVDCRPDSLNIDLDLLEERIGPRARTILLQHTFGLPVDLDGALELADRRGLAVIEDCVHALGACYDGRHVGSFGRAAFFSTEETKTISTTMGGMVTTDDGPLAERLRSFQARCAPPSAALVRRYIAKLVAYHLLTERHVHPHARRLYERGGRRQPLPGPTTPEESAGLRPTRYEQRLANAQALLGLRQLERLERNVSHRRVIARTYAARLERFGVQPPPVPSKASPVYVRYPVRVGDREAAVASVRPHAVPGLWFTSVLGEAADPAAGGYTEASCPNAEKAAGSLVNLPTHPRVSPSDAERLAEAVAPYASREPTTPR
jgi:perosamine synthetase